MAVTRIPPMNELLAAAEQRGLDVYGREALRLALNLALEPIRGSLGSDQPRQLDDEFWAEVGKSLAVLPAMRVRKAINATGTVLHTNLGRAPWPREAVEAVVDAACAAVLEVDPESGERGRREAPVSELLARLTGAQAGLAVNNNAAALLLAVSALGRGRKVVVSRSELVSIGGSYRMPEVILAAGAEMLEVGTTNKVELSDFEQALADPSVSCVLRIHRSNFEIQGFTGEPETSELAALCKEHGVPLVYDLGSGVLHGSSFDCLHNEPTLAQALSDGSDLVCFSGDKLLGGPQAGLIVGAAPLVERLRRDMMTRCLRLDKTMLASLEAVLRIHLLGEDAALERIPSLRMLALTQDTLRERVSHFLENFLESSAGASVSDDLILEAVDTEGRVGSGASPVASLPGAGLAVRLRGQSAEKTAHKLRMGEDAVYGRIQQESVVLDFRTILQSDEGALSDALMNL